MSRTDDSTTSPPAVQPDTGITALKQSGHYFPNYRLFRLVPGMHPGGAEFLSEVINLSQIAKAQADGVFKLPTWKLTLWGWSTSKVRYHFGRLSRPIDGTDTGAPLWVRASGRDRLVRVEWTHVLSLLELAKAEHGRLSAKCPEDDVRSAPMSSEDSRCSPVRTESPPAAHQYAPNLSRSAPVSSGDVRSAPVRTEPAPQRTSEQRELDGVDDGRKAGSEGPFGAHLLTSSCAPMSSETASQRTHEQRNPVRSALVRTSEDDLKMGSETSEEAESPPAIPNSSPDENQIPPEDTPLKPLYAPDEPVPEEMLPDEREPKKFFWVWWRIPGKGEIPPIKYHADSCFPVKGYCPRMEYDDRRYAANKKPVPPPPPPKPKFIPPPYVPVGIPREKDEPGRARVRPWTPLANMLLKDLRLGRECFPSALDWEDYCLAGGLLSRPGEPEKRGSSDNKWHGGDAATVRWPQEHIPAAIRDRIWPPDDPEEKPATRNPGENGAGSDELTKADKARAARLQEFVRGQKWVISGARANWAEAFCSLRRRLARSDIPEAEIDHTLDAMFAARLAHPKILHGKDLESQWAWVRRALNLSDPPPFVTKRAKLLAARLPQHNWHFPPEDLPALVQRCLDAVTPWWEWLKGLEVSPPDEGFRAGVLNRLMSVEYHVRWWMDKWYKALPDLTSWDGNADALVWSPTHKWFRLLLRDLSRQGASDPSKWLKFERKYRGSPCPTK